MGDGVETTATGRQAGRERGASEGSATSSLPLLRALSGEAVWPPPIWLMRQAGRYLPEYRRLREEAGSFLDLCYAPDMAAEVTLQPLRRFGLDAAILFSDILVVPHALGQGLRFVEGEGPVLDELDLPTIVDRPDAAMLEGLAPVMETVERVRAALEDLPRPAALIGFCGAPWTVATYMVGGRGGNDQVAARLMALEAPDAFARLIERLTRASIAYLDAQAQAGAQAVQIFDSWSGALDGDGFARWVVEPTKAIVAALRERHPSLKIIGFPKGSSARLGTYVESVAPDGVGLDWTVPVDDARAVIGARAATQGNLDPMRLVAGGGALDDGVDGILAQARGTPHVFNLGHGIVPKTPPENVARLVERVRSASDRC